MPLYEYLCKNGHRFEKIQSFSAEPVKECPVCQSATERLISASNMQFKGSGFYSTDYGAKRSAPKADSGDGSSKPPASDASTASKEKSPAAASSTNTSSGEKSS